MEKRKFSKLRGLMAEKGLSQVTLAKKLGISSQSVANKFAGKTAFSVKDIMQITEILTIPSEKIGFYFFEKEV